ncbi:MAG: bifunctional DNA-formamidopyrimidine glycosylase/DNA-(apurinic or apyrimidinic site) lyase [Actinomycetales bacterium]|nr:bifunctional DNA-formamidopyrimidine glycosylase/DNA-(apurinic or apyrimidinic site) lyase [Actinomycetales bacterium]
MPELPEVEVVRAGLAPAVDGAVVEGVEVFDARSLRRHLGGADDFARRLTGAVLASPRRRGKFLWIPVAERPTTATRARHDPADPAVDEALQVHLGMSGQMLLREAGAPHDRLTRVALALAHPEHGELRVDFVDQRIFGAMVLEPLVEAADAPGEPGERIPRNVAHIARDPLDARFDDALFLRRLAAKRTTVKRALLDQTLVSGIGNIYADEALWAARLHYDQPTASLPRPRARALLEEVRVVLRKALAEGGTSFDWQYLNVNGQAGYFAHSLNAYDRAGQPCPRCGTPIVREDWMNRGSFRCPRCQRRPRGLGPSARRA